MRLWLQALTVATLLSVQPVLAQTEGWQTYRDPYFGFSALLPTEQFAPIADPETPGVTLRSADGEAQINFHGGPAQDMSRDMLEERLSSGDQIRTITYRAGGASWFVLSGYYEPEGVDEPVIFYTKVLFSPTHDSFSAFEISFPQSDKPRYEDMVEVFEDNFTRPAG